MKMKSAVLASALVAVSSVFADSLYDSEVIYTNWFNVAQSSAVKINEDVPVFFGDNAADSSNGYAVTAQVTVVIHATVPTAEPTNITVNSVSVAPKGSICAAYDNNSVAKWYGLQKAGGTYGWVELTGMATPTEASHTLVTEFDDKTDSGNRVRYWVDGKSSGWLTSGHKNALTKVGLAGSGYYTEVVGLLVNAWSTTIDSVPISISKATLVAMGVDTANTTPDAIVTALTTPESNGIAKWANYVLGINGATAANKPFAAPVQNGNDSTLTFKLGGVNARTGVADVKYAIETLASPTAESGSTSDYVAAGTDQTITLDVPDTVKYYRVKVQIDQTQAQAGN